MGRGDALNHYPPAGGKGVAANRKSAPEGCLWQEAHRELNAHGRLLDYTNFTGSVYNSQQYHYIYNVITNSRFDEETSKQRNSESC
jgi:hypothetical protein